MRPLVAVSLACLLVGAGCLSGGADTPTASPGPTGSSPATDVPASPTETPTDTTLSITESGTPSSGTIAAQEAGDRAIEAETARIRRVTTDWANLTSLSIGDTEPATYTVQERNETGVVVRVRVTHSLSFSCDFHVDGATTEATYLVTAESVELLDVTEDVYGRDDRPRR